MALHILCKFIATYGVARATGIVATTGIVARNTFKIIILLHESIIRDVNVGLPFTDNYEMNTKYGFISKRINQ